MSGAIQRYSGESFAAFTARQRAAQAAEKAARPMPVKQLRHKRRGPSDTLADYPQSDDLGESPDY